MQYVIGRTGGRFEVSFRRGAIGAEWGAVEDRESLACLHGPWTG